MKAIKTQQSIATNIATSLNSDELLGNYAGNGKNLPSASVTLEVSANVVLRDFDSINTTVNLRTNTLTQLSEVNVSRNSIRKLVEQLCEKYPLITIDDEVLGEPRLAGTRFGVSDVLSAFCMYDSIDEIIEEYGHRYSEKQLREAVRYARDFLDSFFTSNV